MSIALRLAAFAAALAVLFGVGAAAGKALDPDREEPTASHGGEEPAASHGGDDEAQHGTETAPGHDVRGLAVAEDGLRLRLTAPAAPRGRNTTLRFAVTTDSGATVRDFDVEHTKRMHVIVVRRDLSGFRHLHPVQQADGSWSVPLRLDEPGAYRVFADFVRGGEKHTLAVDLPVDGPARSRPLAPPSDTATVAGFTVARNGTDFTIRRGGRIVTPERYLGAAGHLVALREGDLAFLHVHPEDGDRPRFETEFPSPGRYRLYLQFQVDGRVHTAAFTEEVR